MPNHVDKHVIWRDKWCAGDRESILVHVCVWLDGRLIVAEEFDVTGMAIEELERIQQNVLRQLALRIHSERGQAFSPHDSHSSNHSKNSVTMLPMESIRGVE